MLFVTHYFIQPVEPDGWIELPYITYTLRSGERTYLLGQDEYDVLCESEVREREENNEIRRLEVEVPINDEQSVWLTSTSNVWLASTADPIRDPNKILLDLR